MSINKHGHLLILVKAPVHIVKSSLNTGKIDLIFWVTSSDLRRAKYNKEQQQIYALRYNLVVFMCLCNIKNVSAHTQNIINSPREIFLVLDFMLFFLFGFPNFTHTHLHLRFPNLWHTLRLCAYIDNGKLLKFTSLLCESKEKTSPMADCWGLELSVCSAFCCNVKSTHQENIISAILLIEW